MRKRWLFVLEMGLVFVIVGNLFAQEKLLEKTTGEEADLLEKTTAQIAQEIESFSVGKSTEALIERGFALVFQRHLDHRNLDRAEALYQKVLEKDPKNVVALYHLSEALLKRGDDLGAQEEDSKQIKEQRKELYQKGLEYAQEAVKINPKDPDAHYWVFCNLGKISELKGLFYGLGKIGTLEKELDVVLELNPDHSLAMESKGRLCYESFRVGKAVEWIKKSLEYDPNYSLAWLDLTRCYIKWKMWEEARQTLNTFFNLKKPSYPSDYVILHKPVAEELLKKIPPEE